MTCQSPLREVEGRWSILTRRVVLVCTGAWECAAVAEMRSAVRRRRVAACDMQESPVMDGRGFSADEMKKALRRHNTSVFEQFAHGVEIKFDGRHAA